MPRMGKSVSTNDAVYGFIAAILILGGMFVWILTPAIWFIALILIIIGALIVMDTIFPYGKQLYAISWIGGLCFGSFTVLILNAFGFLYWILAAAVFAFVMMIAEKLFRRMSR